MTIKELDKKLREAGVKPQYYSLNGKDINDAFILKNELGKWNVYYFEKGSKYMQKYFDSESEACEYIYETLKDEPSVKE
tara:strand:- start:211 stop:447 length:237 start_codon:yes stop_codon:yes gene_type:complete